MWYSTLQVTVVVKSQSETLLEYKESNVREEERFSSRALVHVDKDLNRKEVLL